MTDTNPSITVGIRARVIRNLTMVSGTQLLALVLGMLTSRLLSHHWSSVGTFGGFVYLFSFIYFFQALNDLGINTVLVREIAQAPERSNELVRNMLGLKILMASGSVMGAWIAAYLLPLEPEWRHAVCVFALILPVQAFTLPIVTLQAHLLVGRATIVEAANRIIGFALMIAAAFLGYGLVGVAAALVCGEMVSVVGVFISARGFALPMPAFGISVWREVLKSSLPLGAMGLLVALVNKLDQLMVQAICGELQYSYYGAAYRLTSLLEKLPLLVMGTVYPIMSRLAAEDPRALRRLYHRSAGTFGLIAVPMVCIVTWLAPLIVRLQFKLPEFEPVVPLLRVLVWATVFLYLAIAGGMLLIAMGQQRTSLRIWVVSAPVNVVLNILLIPRFGPMGGAWATVIAFLIVLIGNLVTCERFLNQAILRRPNRPPGVMHDGPVVCPIDV